MLAQPAYVHPVSPVTDTRKVVVDIAGLNKYYSAFHVLKGIDLKVREGERIVLCGPSGSGKSTLIRCINRLEIAEQGRILINDTDLSLPTREASKVRSEIGMVFQHFNLFPHMSVLDNCILAPMSVRGLSRKKAIELAQHFLTKVGIASQADKYPSQLSGGQQQRVAIARALAMNPDAILFDEPTSALDPELVGEVLTVMRKLADEGMTMIVVTHEMGCARDVADKVCFLHGGQIVESGPAQTVLSAPQHPRTQEFLRRLLNQTAEVQA